MINEANDVLVPAFRPIRTISPARYQVMLVTITPHKQPETWRAVAARMQNRILSYSPTHKKVEHTPAVLTSEDWRRHEGPYIPVPRRAPEVISRFEAPMDDRLHSALKRLGLFYEQSGLLTQSDRETTTNLLDAY